MRVNIKRLIASLIAAVMMLSCFNMMAFADAKTGHGMAEWALRAYNEGWKYVYGGSVEGTVDCSGLIRSYINGGGGAKALLNASPESGDIDDMPNIIGLGLWCDGHAGVYVGKNDSGTNMAVDARNSRVNVVYSTMDSRSWNPWVKWFKIEGVEYPTTGWEKYNGKTYYYHNGEFVTGYFTVDGQLYDFGKSGALVGKVDPASTTTATAATTTAKTTATAAPTTTTSTAATTASTTRKTTAATTVSAGALRLGDTGERVAELQRRLKELGYMNVEPTGYFGQKTYNALRQFQTAADLTADGVAGQNTLNVLFSDNAPKLTTTTTTITTTTTTTTTAATTAATASANSESAAATTTTAATTAPSTAPTEPLPEYELLYTTLDFGASGDEVIKLQARLTELGYYDQLISTYYGAFTRLAVMSFQLKIGLPATGTADPQTQWYLYMENAPASDADFDSSMFFNEEDLAIDGGDSYFETETVSPSDVTPEEETYLEPSAGIEGLGTQSDISGFLSEYGDSGDLQTLGIFGFSAPVVTIYHNGESFELSPEFQDAMDDCAFF